MKRLAYIILLLLLPFTLTYGQARVVLTNGYVVENGGTSSKSIFFVVGNSNANAIVPGAGWLISENEFDFLQWNIGTATGTYTVPFGFSTLKYLPLTLDINAGGTGSGVVKFSTYHTIANQYTGVTSLTGDPSDVTNMNAFELPGSPTNANNSYNVADRFYIIDANTGYTTKPSAADITFSYISGTANTEVGSPNTLTESRLMAQRFNSTPTDTTWSDWFGYGCTDVVVNNVGTVQTGPVPSVDMYRSWSLWDQTMPLPLSLTSEDNNCNGGDEGSATVTVFGGASPYTYLWTNGGTTSTISNLTAGTYTVAVNDSHGCTSTSAIIVSQPASAVSVTIASQTNVPCNGGTGSATANGASGGISPYTYSWAPSGGSNLTATGLTVGTYTLNVTDNNGCTSSATAIITEPASLSVLANETAGATCNGNDNGSASSSVSGGTSPYTYAWTGGAGSTSTATGLTAGTYTLSVTDNNGCTSSATVIITQPPILNASANTTANVTCNGNDNGSASSSVSGGTTPYTYTWTGGAGSNSTATGLIAGTYTLNVTDNNDCTSSATAIITQPATLSTTAATTANVSCNGGDNGGASSSVSGGTSPYTYAWSGSAGSNSTATGLATGTYSISVTDNNGCTSSAIVNITQPSSGLSVSVNTTANATCNGDDNGSASSSVSGGTSPYTYAWTGGAGNNADATGLTAGTYTLSVTDNNGCTSSATVTITQPPTLSASANTTANITCNGNDNGSASSSVSGGTTPYTYAWTSGAGSNSTATGLTAGTYILNVTDNNGCTSSAITIITQPTSLIVTAGTIDNVTCHGLSNGSANSTATGGTSPYTYAWSGGAGSTSTVTGLAAGTYSISITDNNGCTGSAIVNITQPANGLSVSANTTANVTCNGNDNGSASSSVTGGTSPYTYAWTGGAGNNADATGLTAGTYTLSVTDNNGCTSSATITITQPPTLSTSASTTANVTCNGNDNGSASSSVTGGTTPYTYVWTGGAGNNADATGLTAGTYTLNVTDNNGCISSATAIITQPSLLSASANATSNITCNGGNNGNALATTSGGNTPYTYAWSNGTSTLSTSNPTGAILSGGTYTVTVTDNNSCTTTASVVITQPASSLSISMFSSSNSSGCITPNGSATASPASGGTAPYTYLWSPSGGTNLTATGLSAGTYTITATDNNGCTAIATAIINQQASNLNITIADSTNSNGCTSFNGNAIANAATGGAIPYTYSWSPSGGNNLTATGLSAGTYTITVTDNSGCTAMATVTISQVSSTLAITMKDSTNSTGCITPNGSATANAATGGNLPYTYSWSPSGGTGITATGLGAGTYTITVTDNTGCTATAAVSISQVPSTLAITMKDSTNSTGCITPNGSATANAATGGFAPYTYSWSPSGGTNITATGLSAGTYTITVKDNNGCEATATVSISQVPSTLAITMDTAINDTKCMNPNGSATANTATGGFAPYTYSWSPSGGNDLTAANLSAGTYTITVTDANGCTATASATIIDKATPPVVTVCCDSTIHPGDNVQLSVSPDSSGYTYSWSPSTGLSCTDCPDPVANPTVTTAYTVTIYDNNGCSVTDSLLIKINDDCGSVYVPSGFSPNGDGHNDNFVVTGTCITSYHIAIYDRWGNRVFETSDINNSWNGEYNGKPMNPGNYIYYMTAETYDGQTINKHGDIALVR